MRQPLKLFRAASQSPKIRLQPDYHSEVSDDYLEAMQRDVDAKKPEGFRLTPVSDAGW